MAGAKNGDFKELISPFLKEKLKDIASEYGKGSHEYHAVASQYLRNDLEDIRLSSQRRRHYESEVELFFEDRALTGVERLYRQTILIEPTTVCAAHCRWCLRGQYPVKTMSQDDIKHAARFIGSDENAAELSEVLITGGDPLMSLKMLGLTLQNLKAHAPNIKTVRIGSRVPFQDPCRINDQLMGMLVKYDNFDFEIGINVNHPIEFWPESIEAIKNLRSIGVHFYNQNPLLKGVNDDFDTLAKLYTMLREHKIEAHYLFHAIPMRGMGHHRTSLKRGLELVSELSASGVFSGRAKPKYAVLSDIGKIVLYQDTIADRNEEQNQVLLRSGFRLDQRLKWNPSWQPPESVVFDNNGTMMTWYEDGVDDDVDQRGELNAVT